MLSVLSPEVLNVGGAGHCRARFCRQWVSSTSPPAQICRRSSRARLSTGFTSGHASWPQVVEVMERIRSSTRTHGRR